ncbi:MAG: ribonuclease HII [Actinomycetota bacterium]
MSEALGLMERRLFEAGFTSVAGADEVGRGALAGPLVAAAVILPPDTSLEGLKDSKLCTRLQRERLAVQIKELALAWSVVRVRHDRIDRDGLQRCNLQALRRALNGLEHTPDYVLLDCFKLRRLPYPNLGVKKGDYVSRTVAAASIIAKVTRDAAMRRYGRRYPGYGFGTNVGYGTRAHWRALQQYGPCEIHRRSFFGVVGFPDEDGVIRPHQARDLDPEEFDLQSEEGIAR